VIETFTLYTDGSCPKPQGPGGWASVCLEDRSYDRGHGAVSTTNNRMELMGAIGGLRALPPSRVTVFSDSEYVIKGFTLYRPKWEAQGWPARIKNQDLWFDLIEQVERHISVAFKHVKGHRGDHYNELADELAGYQTDLFARLAVDN